MLFVVTVGLAEMVPLFPTQPLSLASGLLFGAQKARARGALKRARSSCRRALLQPPGAWPAPCNTPTPPTRGSTAQPSNPARPPAHPPHPPPRQGAALMLLGNTLAALGAFTIARGVGRPLAERVIKAEMGHGGGAGGGEGGSGKGGLGETWARVEAAIESGGFVRQLSAITLLRLTPVIPFRRAGHHGLGVAGCC